jgi:hypothetical protein
MLSLHALRPARAQQPLQGALHMSSKSCRQISDQMSTQIRCMGVKISMCALEASD